MSTRMTWVSLRTGILRHVEKESRKRLLGVAPFGTSAVVNRSSSSKKPTPVAPAKSEENPDQKIEDNIEEPTLRGNEPIYPIYSDVNPLFDTYVKAQHSRGSAKDRQGKKQEFHVSTTLFNDPPFFMIEPRLRPTPRFPTRKYIAKENRNEAMGGSPQRHPGQNKPRTNAMESMDKEGGGRTRGAAAEWGADDEFLMEKGVREMSNNPQRESPLDTALDYQAWNDADLTNDFQQWDRQATPRSETSSLPAPAEAQTLPPSVVSTLMRFPLVTKRVVQQGGKGRMASWYVLTVAGNGEGLVGFGEGKDKDNARATEKSFIAACKDLDWVDRFEGRTLWNNIETKWGSTRVYLRPRPVGFGLRCNPYIHQVGHDCLLHAHANILIGL
jgi:small subunit ribosomal protein S5